MAATYLAQEALLKTLYRNSVQDALNTKGRFFGMLPKDYDGDGEDIEMAHRTGGSGSMGFMSESDTLFTPDRQKYTNSRFYPLEWWGTLEVSEKARMTSKSKRGAYLPLFDAEVTDFAKDTRRQMEIYSMGDGTSIVGVAASASDANDTITLGDTNGGDSTVDIRKFWEGMKFTIFEGATANRKPTATTIVWDGGSATTLTVATGGIDLASGIITVEENLAGLQAAISADDTLCYLNGRGASATAGPERPDATTAARKTMQGIDSIIDDKDPPLDHQYGLQAIKAPKDNDDAAQTGGVSVWASPVLSAAANRPLNESLLQQALDSVEVRGNGSIDYFVVPFGVRHQYAIAQLTIRRNMNTPRLSGDTAPGFTENLNAKDYIEYAGHYLIPDRFCRANTAFGVTHGDIRLTFWARPRWWRDGPTGAILRRHPDLKTTLIAEKRAILEMCVKNRNYHVRIENLSGVEPV